MDLLNVIIDLLKDIFVISMLILWFIALTKIYMVIASYIGEKLGIGKFFIVLYKKIRK